VTYGSGQRAFDRPAEREPVQDGFGFEAFYFVPIGSDETLTVKFQQNISTVISCLLMVSCPPAVASSIWAIVINAINGVCRRTIAHISEKCLKTLAPFVRHHDPARPIIFKAWHARVVAAIFDVFPHAMFSCARASVRAMGGTVLQHTATARAVAVDQTSRDNATCGVATHTSTNPCAARAEPSLFGCWSNDRQAPECLAHQVGSNDHRASVYFVTRLSSIGAI